jgi:predicted PurR-regulated permease PerM
MKKVQPVSDKTIHIALGFIVLCLVIYVLHVARTLLVPLVVAVGVWYLINALAKWYHGFNIGSFKVPLKLCFLVSMVTLGIGIWMIIQLVGDNITQVVQAAPTYQANLESLFLNLLAEFNLDAAAAIQEISSYVNLGDIAGNLARVFTGLVGKTLVVFVYVAFLLIEQRTFSEKIARMIDDDGQESRVREILKNIDEKIRIYLGVKTVMSALTGMLSYLVLKWVGVDFAAFWGLMIFFLNFIPMIGSLVGIIFPALLTLVQFDTYTPFVVVSIGLSSIQMGIGNFLDPKMMGDTLNLSPIVILLSLATWGMIWGIPGMFLSIPIMATTTIVLSQFDTTRPIAVMLSKRGHING